MTVEVDTDQLKQAIEGLHGGTAMFAQSVPVAEKFDGKTVWDGVVQVFDLADNPQSTCTYAWAYELENGKRRVLSVLHTDKINSPVGGRAAIVAEHRGNDEIDASQSNAGCNRRIRTIRPPSAY